VNSQFGDDRQIASYLLGTLPPTETERLDELSIANDEFAERLQAVENDLVDAYVRGDLQGQTLERFTSFYLASSARREKVKFAQAFRAAVEESLAARSGAVGTQGRGVAGVSVVRTSELRALSIPRPLLQWGRAAAIVSITVGLVWLAVENRRLRVDRVTARAEQQASEERERQLRQQLAGRSTVPDKLDTALESPFIVAFNLAPQRRGATGLPAIAIPAAADYVTLQLEQESAIYSSYRAALKVLSEQEPVWRSGTLTAYGRNDSRVVAVSFPPRLLRAPAYLLELTGITRQGAEEPAANFAFRVIRK
jgi:hypothetical protein